MWQTVVLTLLAGVFAANSVPHFVKGITKERFPTIFGSSPLINVVTGWAGFVLSGLLLTWADVRDHPGAAAVAGAAGVLAMALFHASIGAFGRHD